MSVTFTKGSLFKAPARYALVIPVNTEGVAGAGLALQAHYNAGFLSRYHAWLATGRRRGGSVGVFTLPNTRRTWVVVATKERWRNPSRLAWVRKGLRGLATLEMPLAVPALGCGRGGLDWEEVKALTAELGAGAKSDWLVHEPWP